MDDVSLHDLLLMVVHNLLLPAVVGAGCLLLAGIFGWLRLNAASIFLSALTPVGVVFLFLHITGWLQYPPTLSHEWLPYVALGAATVYALAAMLPSTGWWVWLVALEAGVAAAWFFLPGWGQPLYVKERTVWLLVFPQIVLLIWYLFQRMGEASEGAGPVFPMAIWAGAAAPLLILGANARFAQIALIVAGAQGGAALATLLRGPRRWWYHTCPAASVLFLGLLLQGYLYSRTYGAWEEASPHDVPRISFLLVMLSPLASAILELTPTRKMNPWLRRGLQGVLVGLVAGAGFLLAEWMVKPVVDVGWE